MPPPSLIPIPATRPNAARVNVFVHGYRSLVSETDIHAATERVRRAEVPGESFLVSWTAGRWRDSATVAGLRAAYKATRLRYALSPASLLIDAGVVGLHEVGQFKRMERRAEQVGAALPPLIEDVARDRIVHLIGHSLGARVVHHALRAAAPTRLAIGDVVLLGGAADLDAEDWGECLSRIDGRLYNGYSRRDRVLLITPDFRRRVGARPLPQPVCRTSQADGPRVENHDCSDVGHVQYWTRLPEVLPRVWPGLGAGPANRVAGGLRGDRA